MKVITILASLLLTAGAAFADKADDLYKQGMAAIQAGDAPKARALFNEALKARPNHAYARYQLGSLKGVDSSMAAQQRKKALAGISVSVEFDDVELSDALMALSQLVEEKSAKTNGKDKAFTPNFMVQDPSGKLGEAQVTVRLKGVPANKIMDFILQQAGANARYDEHAIIIRPNPTTSNASPK